MACDMKLLSFDYPPNDGGISRLTSVLAWELKKKGLNIEVCTLHAESGKDGLSRPDLPTVELPRRKFLRELGLLRYLMNLPRGCLLITTVWNPEATIAWLIGMSNLYVLAHGNEVMPYPSGLKYKIKGWLRKQVLASARYVICNSQYTEQLVHNISPSIKTTIINPGVDPQRFKIEHTQTQARELLGLPDNKRILLSVSRIDEYKGHEVVLRALSELSMEQRQVLHYVVAGKGSHLTELKRQATELGLDNIITWLGFVPDEVLPVVYRAADLFVLCTREDKVQRGVEGFGMVFLEAQAAGLPVIGTRAGGIPDAIEVGRGGWLIEKDDSNALCSMLETLVDQPEIFASQSKQGQKRVFSECSWNHYIQRLQNLLEKNNE